MATYRWISQVIILLHCTFNNKYPSLSHRSSSYSALVSRRCNLWATPAQKDWWASIGHGRTEQDNWRLPKNISRFTKIAFKPLWCSYDMALYKIENTVSAEWYNMCLRISSARPLLVLIHLLLVQSQSMRRQKQTSNRCITQQRKVQHTVYSALCVITPNVGQDRLKLDTSERLAI